jgi:peptidoglycan/xylan/chitin deacetylase (PgdA/CDA1 family)
MASALVLCGPDLSCDDRNLTALLDLFGIPWKVVRTGDITGDRASPAGHHGRFCILSSAWRMAEALQGIEGPLDALPRWMMNASSVYIYGFQDTDACQRLLRLLTGDVHGTVCEPKAAQTFVSVTANFPAMCGPMSDMRIPIEPSEQDRLFEVHHHGGEYLGIISVNDAEMFLGVTCGGVRFYLNACGKTIDVSAPSTTYFDVKKFFCSAVPITMYLKWAFGDICWTSAETSGCLTVDDPTLTPRYGFLNFREALELMDEHNFTTTIAFIPWNWGRTDPRTVGIFHERPDRFSLCVHGCDHTESEFAARSTALLNRRIKAASQRMDSLLRRTSLQHDHVMVFPQGAFSPETGRALKLNGLVAAVNTEVAPLDKASNTTTIADLWHVAIMKYGSFPLFTRRYLTHGIENFAFDALLGKPCLCVAHHDVFKRQALDLVDFIAKLNRLHWNLRWRTLGEAISHSFEIRHQSDGTAAIHMYASGLVMENPSSEPVEAVVIKEEDDPDCVQAVMVNRTAVDHDNGGGYLTFRVTVRPHDTAQVRVIYFDKLDAAAGGDGLRYGIKVRTRRYLSEFRDNYLSRYGISSFRGN